MAYQIIDVETGNFLVDAISGTPMAYDTGAEASVKAKELAARGRKYRVKRVTDTHWRDREEGKIRSGKYTRLPWYTHDWYCCDNACNIHKHHYAHISKKEPGMIA